jgi:hypothetical protein
MRHDPITKPRIRSRFLWLAIIAAIAITAWAWQSQPNDANSRCAMKDGKQVCAVMD